MKRIVVSGLLVVAVFFGVMLVTGCGSTSTSTLYDTPNWMPDGRIICGKLVLTTSQQLYGGGISESHSYVAAFYPSGTGEVNLFEGWVGDGVNVITCSPIGEMLAGIGDGQIIISDYNGNKTTVPNTSNVQYLDWSPDATKLVFSDTSRDLYVINRDGTGKTKIATSSEAVAWRVGEKIAYGYLYTINSDGSDNQYLVDGGKPQIMNSGKIIYYADLISPGKYKIKSIYPNGTDESEVLVSYDRNTLMLSFDNTKIVGGVTGDTGIWLMNIDGTGYTKIR